MKLFWVTVHPWRSSVYCRDDFKGLYWTSATCFARLTYWSVTQLMCLNSRMTSSPPFVSVGFLIAIPSGRFFHSLSNAIVSSLIVRGWWPTCDVAAFSRSCTEQLLKIARNSASSSQALPSHVYLWRNRHPENRSNSRLYTGSRHFPGFMFSKSDNVFQSWSYPGCKSTQVPHTSSVTQALPSHVYLWRNRHPGNRSNSRLYTRSRQLSTFTFSTSTNVLQSWSYPGCKSTQVPHTYAVTQSLLSHVYLWRNRHPEYRWNSRLYTGSRHFPGFMISTSANVLQWQRYPGHKSTQVPHTHSVTQPLSAKVYFSKK